MPALPDIGRPPPIQAGSGGGHGNHDAAAPASLGRAFSSVLAQTIGQSLNNDANVNAARHSGGHAPGTNVRGGSVQHGLLMTGGANQRGAPHGLQETALGLRAYRQQLLAGNIANADTPGYKAVDIDFQEGLRIAQTAARISPLALTVAGQGHIPARAVPVSPPFPLKYHTPSQPSADGNTVEMDVERAKFAENALMYEFSLDRVSGHSKMMMELFQNLKS